MTFAWSTAVLFDEDLEDSPLSMVFDRCYEGHKHIADLPSDAEQAQTILRRLLRMLQHCDALIDSKGVLSENEEKDDITTGSLRCGSAAALV
jgi:TAP42-like family